MLKGKLIILILTLTAQLAIAGSIYPKKIVLSNGDTVICSTLEQQQLYNSWFLDAEECSRRDSANTATIVRQDSSFAKQERLLNSYIGQAFNFQKYNDAIVRISEGWQMKFDVMDNAFKKQNKQIRRRNIGFGVGGGAVVLTFVAYSFIKLAKL